MTRSRQSSSPRRATAARAVCFSAAGILFALLGSPNTVRAQAVEPRPTPASNAAAVDLILERLPRHGTRLYAMLERQAGSGVRRQRLPLTGAEVWTLPAGEAQRLARAARAQGVRVTSADATAMDILAPMTRPHNSSRAMHDMMQREMAAPSTARMSMMAMPDAGMLEYALTHGMQEPGHAPAHIRIKVDPETTVTAIRQSVRVEGDRCTWQGIVEGSMNPVTILWWKGGHLTGTLSIGQRNWQLKSLGSGVIGVVETVLERLPDEHPRMPPERMQRLNLDRDTMHAHGDGASMRPRRGEIEHLKDDAARPGVAGGKVALAPPDHGIAQTPRDAAVSIDVLVVYTARAAAHFADIRRDLVDLAIEQTNQSFRSSGVGNVSVRLAGAKATAYDEQGAQHFDHVWRMVDRGDGFLEEVPALRDRLKADLVVLVVDDPSGCGLSTRVAASADEAYAVVHYACAATSYSITHEIGHLIGARHDRSLDESNEPFAWGHGYVSPDRAWRTMMSYQAGCSGCPRLPIWSTPARVVNGRAAGDELTDNARVIRESAARAAAFR